jgi:hypothetical protein
MNAPVNALKAIQDDFRKREVWAKGALVIQSSPNGAVYIDPDTWRYDAFGALIKWADYGDRQSRYGWEIDHTIPVALGGSDALANLRPLHFLNNASLGGGLGAAMANSGIGNFKPPQ